MTDDSSTVSGATPFSRPALAERGWSVLRGVSPWLALALLAGWTRELSAWWLVAASALVLASLLPPRRVRPGRALGIVLLLAAIASGFAAHRQLARLSRDWDAYWEAREANVYVELERQLEELLDRGERAVQDLVLLVESHGGLPPLARIEDLRRSSGFPAVAVYGPDGIPAAWSGTHRGRIPDAVQLGLEPYVYGELPLFSYLYFTAPIRSTGGTAVVPALLRTELPPDLHADPGDLVSRFRELTGEEIRISTAERATDRAVYDLSLPDRTLFSIEIVRPGQAERLRRVRAGWVRLVVALLSGGWLLLALGLGRDRRAAGVAASTLALLLAILPWPLLLDEAQLFSAADFLLPSPGTVTLGRLLALALAGCVIAGLLPLAGRGRLPGALAALVVGAGFPLLVGLVAEGASMDFLARGERDWVIYQVTLAALLALVGLAAFGVDRRDAEPPGAVRPGVIRLTAAVAVMAALASVAAWHVRARGELPLWAAAAWALPAFLALPVVRSAPAWRRPLLLWVSAAVLGTSAALPYAWSHRVAARMTIAEAQLGRLGAGVDPYLEDLLLPRLGVAVDSLHRQGASPIELLFRLASGLAQEGYPVWTTLWSSGGIPLWHLPIGVGDMPRSTLAGESLERARQEGRVRVRRFSDPDAHYMVQVPLADGSVVSGVIPPVRGNAPFSPLAHLFGSLSEGQPDPLELVPLIVGDVLAVGETPRWYRTDQGLRAEVGLVFPATQPYAAGEAHAMYHAQYRVDLPPPPILLARATLLLALNLLVLLAFWGAGRVFAREPRPAGVGTWRLLTSFRARVTLALFGFFLLSNAIFGTLAYRNIAGAAERAAQVLAERIAQDAAELYLEIGRIDQLARRVGGDLLEYRNGQLTSGAAEEPVELGLYEGLIPFDVFNALRSGRELVDTRGGALGRWEYVTAYRRLADGKILAVPVPLQAGATAVRRREVADLLLFAIVAGAALSLVLALLVGRTLTRPIRTLQVASERVGSGNLGVRLRAERSDEFGAVFSAFNRMVRRLRRARGDLVRQTRRTQAIVEDAATGVIALDAQARVTLVNPRAEALLGRDVPVGRRLSDAEGPAVELVRWVQLYFRDRLLEAASEFQFGERRIRVRARRITRGEGSAAGAVLSLEDVTDELRAERILAWGEMARQVAHEVKNPLTPIKLSIQHIQRARADRRPDFDDILTRNADAMLMEIERLAAIASSFSRFGAPTESGAAPLEPVRVDKVVAEVLALYSMGEGPIRFELDVPAELPSVRARESEMKEVLVNLLENARAAIEEEGTVCVEARAVEAGVVLRVRDDGSGIPSELLPRIFEPHFSTRSSGTGLGLAIVRRLVEAWDAAVSVESEVGRGTVIHIWLRPWH
jgi:two-component system, NtrC family, nitrogen regulation sensor histidine kinase NtrY